MIIEKQTVVVSASPSAFVQPQQFDESTLQLNIKLQQRKIELLEQIQMPDKDSQSLMQNCELKPHKHSGTQII